MQQVVAKMNLLTKEKDDEEEDDDVNGEDESKTGIGFRFASPLPLKDVVNVEFFLHCRKRVVPKYHRRNDDDDDNDEKMADINSSPSLLDENCFRPFYNEIYSSLQNVIQL